MSVRIGLALAGWPFKGQNGAPFFEFVEQAESLGFDSLWLSDRLVSTSLIMEPLSALAMAAARTRSLKFGMSVLVLPLRNPVLVAKEIATIDFLSGSRMLPAFGLGTDDLREYEAAGISQKERAGRTDESIELLRRLWSEEHVTHHGRYFNLSDVTIAPRPAQPLPIWFGGRSEAAYRRIGRLGDGWLASFLSPGEFADGRAAIERQAEQFGRAIDGDHFGAIISIGIAASPEDAMQQAGPALRRRPDIDVQELSAFGTADQCVARLQEYLRAGCSKFVLRPACQAEELPKQLELIAREVAPRFDLTMAAA